MLVTVQASTACLPTSADTLREEERESIRSSPRPPPSLHELQLELLSKHWQRFHNHEEGPY